MVRFSVFGHMIPNKDYVCSKYILYLLLDTQLSTNEPTVARRQSCDSSMRLTIDTTAGRYLHGFFSTTTIQCFRVLNFSLSSFVLG